VSQRIWSATQIHPAVQSRCAVLGFVRPTGGQLGSKKGIDVPTRGLFALRKTTQASPWAGMSRAFSAPEPAR
jgi:hypothetical protein